MGLKGIIRRPEWVQELCPFCGKRLGRIEIVWRKVRKICKCKNCGKIIDE